MNYSSRFRSNILEFITSSGPNMPNITISDIDSDCIFCYMKNTPIYQVVVSQQEGDVVFPLKKSNAAPIHIEKAEDILGPDCIRRYGVRTVMLHNEIYYAYMGLIFNKEKSPIVVSCHPKTELERYEVICIDYSVLENPDEPMHRFILRKFIPFLVQERDRNMFVVRYSIMNCRSFVIKPTFQGELDHELVGKYLAGRISNELENVTRREKRRTNRVP